MDTIVTEVQRQLKANADEQVRIDGKRFFKDNETTATYGVKIPVVNQVAKDSFTQLKHTPKTDIFALCETLWQSGYLEDNIVACTWAYNLRRQYQPDDFAIFERWISRYVDNWASCDTLCNHTIGTFVDMYPQFIDALKNWTTSPNRWNKRAAAVTLIIPARNGLFLKDIFEIADSLLTDPDDLVQKGYGWMLKAASEAHPQAVFDYLLTKKTTMPRTAFRYALEKMPADWRAEAMKKG